MINQNNYNISVKKYTFTSLQNFLKLNIKDFNKILNLVLKSINNSIICSTYLNTDS